MYLSPTNYQSSNINNRINQKNQKISINNTDTITFKGVKINPKVTNESRNIIAIALAGIATIMTTIKLFCSCDKEFNQALQNRLNSMVECDSYGKVPEHEAKYDKKILKEAYSENPELVKQLMVSTVKDGNTTWTEYSADAIKLIVENNKEHPEKTELLKKCLSRSYEFNDSTYAVRDIINTGSDDIIQKALIEAGYQENGVYNYPKTFYSPYLFKQQFNR
jgi:hypothetical protein